MYFTQKFLIDTPSITAKLISEQKDDKEKKNHEEKEKVKAENGFQDNYSVVVCCRNGLSKQRRKWAYSLFYDDPGHYSGRHEHSGFTMSEARKFPKCKKLV